MYEGVWLPVVGPIWWLPLGHWPVPVPLGEHALLLHVHPLGQVAAVRYWPHPPLVPPSGVSVGSVAEVHPVSAGWSIRLSPSLSMPSEHAGAPPAPLALNVAMFESLEQPLALQAFTRNP